MYQLLYVAFWDHIFYSCAGTYLKAKEIRSGMPMEEDVEVEMKSR